MKLPVAITRILLAACFLAPVGWIFREAIFTSRSFVFRDAAHYYYPLFQWTAREWGAGRIPLWNPLENCGSPALADPTTSVFYPGKLLFALPLDFGTRYKVYLLSHVLLAGGAAAFVARRWRASAVAATACGLSYACGGSVVFQYCNAVYLVGAAWLPLALWTAEGLLRRRRWSWAVGLGLVLAMIVLGGDPQTAYHAGLVAGLGWLVRRSLAKRARAIARRRGKRSATFKNSPALPCPAPRRRAAKRSPLLLLAAAALAAGLLAAVQILPAWRWTQRSERAAFDRPRSIYEVPEWLSRKSEDAREPKTIGTAVRCLGGQPMERTHHEQIYEFSVGPWRWAELVWPNFSGRLFPIDRRWTSAIPAEGRVWTPSLYLGLAPLLAALAVWTVRGGSWRTRWLSWTVVLAMAAALGVYGVGWLWLEWRNFLGEENPQAGLLGAPTGGMYWLLVNVLPGYACFRYPAKWLPVAALALSLLAARGWDRAFIGRSRRAARFTIAAFGLSVLGIAAWFAVQPYWREWLSQTPPDALFGPLDADGAARDLLFAFVHALLLAGGLLVLMRCTCATAGLPSSAGFRSARPLIALLLTALDLGLAHGWMAPTAPDEIWRQTSPAAAMIAADAARRDAGPPRVHRGSPARWAPEAWTQASSPARQIEGLRWDCASLFPKHHLAPGLPLIECEGALAAADYAAVLDFARRHGFKRPDSVREPPPEVLGLLGAEYVVLPHGAKLPGGESVEGSKSRRVDESKSERVEESKSRRVEELRGGELSDISVWRNSPALPRAWIVGRVIHLPPLTDESPAALRRRAREALWSEGGWRDFRQEAVVEAAIPADSPALSPENSSLLTTSTCRIATDDPQRIEIDVQLPAPALLVLRDFYDDDWQAAWSSASDPAPRPHTTKILRTDCVLRGVWLPAGSGRVTFVYRPTTFYLGAAISLAAWTAVLIGFIVANLGRGREPKKCAPVRTFSRSHGIPDVDSLRVP